MAAAPTNESQNEPQQVQADSTHAILPPKKKGFSARDCKLVKNYDSFEAAKEAAKARANEEDVCQQKLDKKTIVRASEKPPCWNRELLSLQNNFILSMRCFSGIFESFLSTLQS